LASVAPEVSRSAAVLWNATLVPSGESTGSADDPSAESVPAALVDTSVVVPAATSRTKMSEPSLPSTAARLAELLSKRTRPASGVIPPISAS
jgi:hypothetical protein